MGCKKIYRKKIREAGPQKNWERGNNQLSLVVVPLKSNLNYPMINVTPRTF
tara:strand:- start:175 stop:327 length:153 start_codon:yes stop_codon:yes gene_type:complete